MFKFGFDVEEDPEIDALLDSQSGTQLESQPKGDDAVKNASQSSALAPFVEHSLDELLKTLPSTGFSFSPIHIPSYNPQANADPVILPRRDLFDARFQLIASSSSSSSSSTQTGESQNPGDTIDQVDSDLQFVEAPSDLIPGVYEGGLKTWECSVDLTAYLHDTFLPHTSVVGKRILELGCGTAIPSMYLLRQAFSQPPSDSERERTAIHLQDYNELVFRLAVLPNIILTWYMSPASASFRNRTNPNSTPADDNDNNNDEEDNDNDDLPPADPSHPGDLPITPTLLTAFRHSLTQHNIDLRFFSGPWEAFTLDTPTNLSKPNTSTGTNEKEKEKGKGKYDVVLTSETIYRVESLPSLLDLMWRACTGRGKASPSLEELTSELSISGGFSHNSAHEHDQARGTDETDADEGSSGTCIVAAKLVYFGVGGGVTEFVDAVQDPPRSSSDLPYARQPGSVRTVWRKDEGVKRVIMEVNW